MNWPTRLRSATARQARWGRYRRVSLLQEQKTERGINSASRDHPIETRGINSALLFGSWIFALLLCALLNGCMRRDPPADVTIINYSEPQSLDPAIVAAQPDMRIVSGIFEGLTRVDPKTGRAIPGLAERWEVSPDGRIYTFHLRTNLLWSTGEPIRAADVVYSLIRTLAPATASDYSGQLFYVKNAEAFNAGKTNAADVGVKELDPFTVRIELNNP